MDCVTQMLSSKKEEPLFRFYWLDGKVNEGYGLNVSDAFNKLGYGAGAVGELDYWELVK